MLLHFILKVAGMIFMDLVDEMVTEIGSMWSALRPQLLLRATVIRIGQLPAVEPEA